MPFLKVRIVIVLSFGVEGEPVSFSFLKSMVCVYPSFPI